MKNGFWSWLLHIASAEWLLARKERPNGGGVVLARALFSSTLVYSLILAVRELLDPSNTFGFSFTTLRQLLLETMPWFGAIFVGIFTSLYTRFSQQWTYLANLYNQIKATEAREATNEKARPLIAQWKAGFIEDAKELHLANKPLFATVIKSWTSDKLVRAELDGHGKETRGERS